MRHREPRNRAERRAAQRAAKRLVKAEGKLGVKTRYRVLDKAGRDVTAERMTAREEQS